MIVQLFLVNPVQAVGGPLLRVWPWPPEEVGAVVQGRDVAGHAQQGPGAQHMLSHSQAQCLSKPRTPYLKVGLRHQLSMRG